MDKADLDSLQKILNQFIDKNLIEALKRDMEMFDNDDYHLGSPALYNAISQFLKNQGMQVDVDNDDSVSDISKAADKVRARREAKLASVTTIPKPNVSEL